MTHKLHFLLRTALLLAVALISIATAGAQGRPDPVQWSLKFDPAAAAPGGQAVGILTATIQPGWHLYSLTTPKGGPNATKITVQENPAVSGLRIFQPAPKRQFDPAFKLETETFDGTVTLLLEIALDSKASGDSLPIAVQARYQACQNSLCLPPVAKVASATLTLDRHVRSKAPEVPANYKEVLSQ